MQNRPDITLAEQFSATIAWWRDAGVDFEFTDEVEPLLTEAEQAPRPAQKPKQAIETEAPVAAAIKAADLPGDLAAFRNWWVGPENPFASGPSVRIAPIGKESAPIMVLTAMPEAEDRDSLLSGPQGRMLGNVLRAMGLDPNAAYLASALPSHVTLPDWDDLSSAGLGTVIAHHVGLARPQRVLLLGSKLPALLGHDPAAPPEAFAAIGDTATLATFSPDRLLDHARQRARLWKRLCQWIASA